MSVPRSMGACNGHYSGTPEQMRGGDIPSGGLLDLDGPAGPEAGAEVEVAEHLRAQQRQTTGRGEDSHDTDGPIPEDHPAMLRDVDDGPVRLGFGSGRGRDEGGR
jgi:hypothetical protein